MPLPPSSILLISNSNPTRLIPSLVSNLLMPSSSSSSSSSSSPSHSHARLPHMKGHGDHKRRRNGRRRGYTSLPPQRRTHPRLVLLSFPAESSPILPDSCGPAAASTPRFSRLSRCFLLQRRRSIASVWWNPQPAQPDAGPQGRQQGRARPARL
ncbi:unnamed protein product [Musa textilis]